MKKVNKKLSIALSSLLGLSAIVGVSSALASCKTTKDSIEDKPVNNKDDKPVNDKVNFMTTFYNNLDYSLALGIQPDIIQAWETNSVRGKADGEIPEYLKQYIDKSKSQISDIDFSNTSTLQVDNLKIHTIAVEQAKLPQNSKILANILAKEGLSNDKPEAVHQANVYRFNDGVKDSVATYLNNGNILNAAVSDRGDTPAWRTTNEMGWKVYSKTSKTVIPTNDIDKYNAAKERLGKSYAFFANFNDAYATFKGFATSLGLAGYDFNNFTWLKDKFPTSNSFMDYANKVNLALKQTVQKVAKLDFMPKENDHKTLLAITGPWVTNNTIEGIKNGSNIDGFNSFYMEQPFLHQNLYGMNSNVALTEKNVAATSVGLNFYFPEPLKTEANKTKYNVDFDDYYEISSSANDEQATAKPQESEKLSNQFVGTADYVIYFYNSYVLGEDGVQKLKEFVNSVNNDEDNKGNPNAKNYVSRMLAKGGKILLLDKQMQYISTFGTIGVLTNLEGFAEAINEVNNVGNKNTIDANNKKLQDVLNASAWKPFAKEKLNKITFNSPKPAVSSQGLVSYNNKKQVENNIQG